MSATAAYPAGRGARDRFVLDRRPSRRPADPWAPPRVVVEQEPDAAGRVVDVATLFLTGRECPWRCVMCDLWRDTTTGDTPPGAIPWQVRVALSGLESGSESGSQSGTEPRTGSQTEARTPPVLKLYNAGSFFDPRAVPPADDAAIADAVRGVDRVIVEAHPRLIGDRAWRFRDRLAARGASLEVAVGLETAEPEAFDRLNKGCAVEDVVTAAAALAAHGVALRVFLLVHPPFVAPAAREATLARSVDLAVDARATAIALIPTRGGNGAMEALAAEGAFAPPSLVDLEAAAAIGLGRARGRARVFADLWDLDGLAPCAACREARRARLQRLNLEQRLPAAVACDACGAATPACR